MNKSAGNMKHTELTYINLAAYVADSQEGFGIWIALASDHFGVSNEELVKFAIQKPEWFTVKTAWSSMSSMSWSTELQFLSQTKYLGLSVEVIDVTGSGMLLLLNRSSVSIPVTKE